MLGELNAEQIEQVLRAEVIGRIGCAADGEVYVVPVTYAYDGESVYGHTTEGRKLKMMRAAPRVCFEVEQVETLASWRSVIAWGRFEELRGEEAGRGMQVLMRRLMPLMADAGNHPTHGLHPTPSHQADTAGRAAAVYRIRLDEKTGRFEAR